MFGQGFKHFCAFTAKLDNIEGLLIHLQLALFEAGEFQKVGQEVENMVGRLLYRVDFLFVAFLVHQFHIAHDGTQRCLDVM